MPPLRIALARMIALAPLLAGLLLVAPALAQPAADGCGLRPAAVGVVEGSVESGGDARAYRLYIPAGYDPDQPTALVFSLHGFASNAGQQARFSGFDALAEAEGFIAVYPQGAGLPPRWNAGIRGLNGASLVDDVAFINDLLDHLAGKLCVDPARIYMTGLSNGGGMSHRLACDLAERVAAIGTVAGAYPLPEDDACAPSRPVPVIAFHGTADRIVPYAGNQSLAAAPAWAAAWAARNGCDPTPASLPSSGSVSAVRYGGCAGGAEVVFYTVAGGGHTWPGGLALPAVIVGRTSRDVDASRLMWAFFQAHPLE
ncbi:MAG: extracellular catalytic domain type 1 short-chain-length polyhydroxyalkanoate depolymerase [Aggregatilineales bacterium]